MRGTSGVILVRLFKRGVKGFLMSWKSFWAKISNVLNPTPEMKAAKYQARYVARLDQAIARLLQDSEIVASWYAKINQEHALTIATADLETGVEARTWIHLENEPSIILDLQAIASYGDWPEPVLAHEIGHVYDAYYTYGVARFIEIVNAELQLPWHLRTVEKSAIAREDAIRAELRKDHPKLYSGMPRTRKAQNRYPSI